MYNGLRGAFASCYRNIVRKCLPVSEPVLYSGIPVGIDRKVGDRLAHRFGFMENTKDIDDYEEALIKALNASVRPGDHVVVVGGGLGVTVAFAAKKVGPTGSVICYEGDKAGVKSVIKTVGANFVSSMVVVKHAVVGSAVRVYGNEISDLHVRPEELPNCDVLELDCEGSELGILSSMKIRPRFIAVECHGALGSPAEDVRNCLEQAGYRVTDLGWAEPRLLKTCEELECRVLTAEKLI